MVREKRTNVKRLPPIDLDLDQPDQKRLWDHYQKLSKSGNAADWIRRTLAAALPPLSNDDAPASDAVPTLTYDQVVKGVHRKNEATMYPIDDHERQFGKINLGDEQRYVDIED